MKMDEEGRFRTISDLTELCSRDQKKKNLEKDANKYVIKLKQTEWKKKKTTKFDLWVSSLHPDKQR